MMASQRLPYRVGPDDFETDDARLQRALERYDEGKGLIGGDPTRRPRWLHPLPNEPAPAFRLQQSSPEHLDRLRQFLDAAPLEIEIGCGPGDFILDWSWRRPRRHFLAFEVKWKLVREIVRIATARDQHNLWVSDDDARYDLPRILQPGSVDIFHILFPDPWWKPKHQARRLFVPPFVDVLALLLRPGGVLRVATDVPGYARAIQEVVAKQDQLAPAPPETAARFAEAAPTSRQSFCEQIGRPYQLLYYVKK